jgi:DNA-binding response OmpR family regulator
MRRVLVVEPDKYIRESLGQVLSLLEEFQVRIRTSASEAIREIPGFVPDVLLFDGSLYAADLATMTHLAKSYGAKIVAMTTQTKRDPELRRDFGASVVLLKPFEIEELDSALK